MTKLTVLVPVYVSESIGDIAVLSGQWTENRLDELLALDSVTMPSVSRRGKRRFSVQGVLVQDSGFRRLSEEDALSWVERLRTPVQGVKKEKRMTWADYARRVVSFRLNSVSVFARHNIRMPAEASELEKEQRVFILKEKTCLRFMLVTPEAVCLSAAELTGKQIRAWKKELKRKGKVHE